MRWLVALLALTGCSAETPATEDPPRSAATVEREGTSSSETAYRQCIVARTGAQTTASAETIRNALIHCRPQLKQYARDWLGASEAFRDREIPEDQLALVMARHEATVAHDLYPQLFPVP